MSGEAMLTERYERSFSIDGLPVPAVRMTQRSKHRNRQAQRYLDYKQAVGWAYKAKYGGDEPFTGPVALSVEVCMGEPEKRRWDASNVLKAVEDSLNKIAYLDDKQITMSSVEVCPSRDGSDFVYVLLEGEYMAVLAASEGTE